MGLAAYDNPCEVDYSCSCASPVTYLTMAEVQVGGDHTHGTSNTGLLGRRELLSAIIRPQSGRLGVLRNRWPLPANAG